MPQPFGVTGARRTARVVAGWLVVLTAAAIGCGPAFAQADLELAQPGAGIGVERPPREVALRFSEPLDLRLSRIRVVDSTGTDVATGATLPVVGDPQAIRRALDRPGPGKYQVRWTSVSRLDGRLRRGTYGFSITGGADPVATVASGPTATAGSLGVIGRWIGLLGLLLWAGLGLLAPLAGRVGVAPALVTRLGVAAPGLAFVGFGLAAAAAAQAATGSVADVGAVLSGSTPARWRMGELVLAAAAVLAAGTAARRPGRPARVLSGLATGLGLTALVAEAASGHAAAASHPVRAVAVLAAHLGSVSVWLTALVLALLGGRAVAALAVLSPAIIGAAVVVVASGEATAGAQVTSVSQLTGTDYGRVVLVKATLLAVMTTLALAHYVLRRRSRPPTGVVAGAVRFELAAGVAAVAVGAALVGFPAVPREEAGLVDIAAGASADPGTSPTARLVGQAAVTVAAPSGPFIVGVALSPPRPGRVRLDLTVLGTEPGDGLRNARLDGHVATASARDTPGVFSTALKACGLGCFTGAAEVAAAGQWQLRATITSNRGPISLTETVALPAPDGSALLAKTVAAMGGLRSAHVSETLRGDPVTGPTLRSVSSYNAPNAARIDITGGSSTLLIGGTTYTRDTPTAPWSKDAAGAPFVWPGRLFSEMFHNPVAVRLLAADPARATAVIGLTRPDGQAWYRLTVDTRTARLRHLQMRAPGHLMEQDYTAYDAAPRVVPPG